MKFYYGDVQIDIPDDYIHVLAELAFVKGMVIAEKLEDAEYFVSASDSYSIDLDAFELEELVELLKVVIE